MATETKIFARYRVIKNKTSKIKAIGTPITVIAAIRIANGVIIRVKRPMPKLAAGFLAMVSAVIFLNFGASLI